MGEQTSDEESIASENSPFIAIFEEITDRILGMAGRVERFDRNLSHIEFGVVRWCPTDLVAVFSADDRNIEVFQQLCIAACMVVMMMSIQDCG